MRHHRCFFIIIAILFLFSAAAAENDGLSAEIYETEWSWEENATAVFEGTVTGKEPLPEKILLRLEFTAAPENTDPGEVVFSSVNGKKLTLRKQKPEYVLETGGTDSISFTGSWKTPESVLFTKVEITLLVYTEDESVLLAERKLTVSRNASEMTTADDGKFRIRENFSGWTIIAAAAAGIIWAAAVIRIVLAQRKKEKER